MSKPVPIIPIPPGALNPFDGMSILTGSQETKSRTDTFLNEIFADLRKHIPRSLRLNNASVAPWSDAELISNLSEPLEKQVWIFTVHLNPSVLGLVLTALGLGLDTFLICDCLEEQEGRVVRRLERAGATLMTKTEFRHECNFVIQATSTAS